MRLDGGIRNLACNGKESTMSSIDIVYIDPLTANYNHERLGMGHGGGSPYTPIESGWYVDTGEGLEGPYESLSEASGSQRE